VKPHTSLRSWRPEDLLDTRSYKVVLDTETLQSLRRLQPDFVLPEAKADAAFRAELPSSLTVVARRVLRLLGPEGPGFAVVTADGIGELNDAQLTGVVFGLSVLLGRPIGQNAEDERIVSVLDERPADVQTARGYRTNAALLMHTDPTDVFSLMCLQPSAHGGSSVYVSASAVLDALTDEAPDLVHAYFRLWDWDLRGIQRPGAAQIVPTPIFSYYAGELSCRYGSLMLREGERNGSRGLRSEDEAALEHFEAVAQRPELALRYVLQRGESMWVNNYRVLHGRDAFEDDCASGGVRHLLRTWVWLHERPALAASFSAFAEAIDRGGLRR
jgi:hypothetical protein